MSELAPAPQGFALKGSISWLVLRCQRLLSQQLEAKIADHGLTISQFVPLQLVYEGCVCVASDIAKTLGYDTGSTTRILDQLSDKGLIQRRRDEGRDRRLVSLEITPQGRRTAEAIQAASAAFADELFEPLTAEEESAVMSALSCLLGRLEKRSSA